MRNKISFSEGRKRGESEWKNGWSPHQMGRDSMWKVSQTVAQGYRRGGIRPNCLGMDSTTSQYSATLVQQASTQGPCKHQKHLTTDYQLN